LTRQRCTPSTTDIATAGRWTRLLDDIACTARADGVNAAEWWAQDTVGGRAHGTVTTTARAVLDGIDAVDPKVLDTLPQPGHDSPERAYRDHADTDLPTWDTLDPRRRADVTDTYHAGFDAGAHAQVCAACTAVLEPAGRRRAAPGGATPDPA
jgi:hypothetical protein